MRIPVAIEGAPFILAFAVVAGLGTTFIQHWAVDIVLWTLAFWCLWFFRDPERTAPEGDQLIIAPADGRVCAVEEVASAPLTGEPARKLSIFMNVFNVHVNRAPAAGEVRDIAYHPGRFLNAALDKASLENERMELLLALDSGEMLPCVQVAGLVARRIVCRVKKGAKLAQGERFGLIRFGSRVDLYLPLSADVSLVLGDKTVAGETIVARLNDGSS